MLRHPNMSMHSINLGLNVQMEKTVSLLAVYIHAALEDNAPSLDKVCVCGGYFQLLSPSKPTLEISILGI